MTKLSTISPEYRLLLAAADPRPIDQRALSQLHEVDWDEVLRLAAHHHVSCLLHEGIAPFQDAIPNRVLSRLRSQRQRTTAIELGVRRQLRSVAEALESSGVGVVAMKGAALIQTVYREPGLRPMADVDLLVPEDGILRAAQALEAAGFRRCPDIPRPLLAYFERGEHQHLAPLIHHRYPLSIELHKRLTLRIDDASTEDVLARSVRSQGGLCPLPDPTDLLFQLAIHFAEDRRHTSRAALLQLGDMAHTIERQPIDWNALEFRSYSYGLAGAVFVALYVLAQLDLAVVPAVLLDALKPQSWSVALGRRLVSERVLSAPDRLVWGGPPRDIRRFFVPGRAHMRARYNLPDASLPRLYLTRARVALGMLAPVQFALNRWLRRAVTPRLSRTPPPECGTARHRGRRLRRDHRVRQFR